MSIAARILLGLIRLYQFTLSALMGKQCRFYPSCSHYTAEAIRRHGALRGGYLGAGRILRCHPWNPGGVDPVPETFTAPRWGRGKFFSEKSCDCVTHAPHTAHQESSAEASSADAQIPPEGDRA